MTLLERLKKWWSGNGGRIADQKSWWTPLGGSGTFRNTYDAFHGQAEPTKLQLVKAYDDITYACVSMIAQNISRIPIRLYVRTAPGQRQPKCLTAKPKGKQLARIQKKYMGCDVKEVVEHPLLSLIRNCNTYHNQHDLLELTEIYLDLSGNSYWKMNYNTFGIPESLFLLPSHNVSPERDAEGYVREWVFGQGIDTKHYSLKEVIHFKYNNPLDPYGEGVSPLRGAWGRQQISSKELSYLDNYLSNMGKPDAVLAIKDSVNPQEAERLQKEYFQRFSGQGNGGVLVTDGTMNLSPLNFPAKDLAELQLYQVLKTVICNCFHIPPDIFELGSSSNRSTREAALYSLASQCLQPRIEGITQKLNDKLVPYFDERFFFEADLCVPEDKEFELQKTQLLLSQQVITRDEARIQDGYESKEWAKEPLLPSGVMPADAFDQPEITTPEVAPEPQVPEEKDRTAQAAQVQQLQSAVYSGQLPREAALANAQLLFGFTPEEAAALLPDIAPKPPQATQEAPGKPEEEQDQGEDQQPPQEAAKAILDTGRYKMLDLASPAPLVKALQSFFKELQNTTLSRMKGIEEGVTTKAVPVVDFFSVEGLTENMVARMRPVIQAYYDHGSKETIAQLNLTRSMFETVQPMLREGVNEASLVFCQETLETTRLDLDEALNQLRKELTEGLVEGDVKNAMMQRVQKVFEDASNYRAFRIGVTESSRAQHAAMMITAEESGVVRGKTWLLSDDACPLCKPLSGKTVGLDENFTVDGTGPYSEISHPPRHPNCRCNILLDTGDE